MGNFPNKGSSLNQSLPTDYDGISRRFEFLPMYITSIEGDPIFCIENACDHVVGSIQALLNEWKNEEVKNIIDQHFRNARIEFGKDLHKYSASYEDSMRIFEGIKLRLSRWLNLIEEIKDPIEKWDYIKKFILVAISNINIELSSLRILGQLLFSDTPTSPKEGVHPQGDQRIIRPQAVANILNTSKNN